MENYPCYPFLSGPLKSVPDNKGYRDNLQIKTFIVTLQQNGLTKTVLMKGHNICFH